MTDTTDKLESALDWLTATPENTLAFRQDFSVIHDAVKGLSVEDISVLQAIHDKGVMAARSVQEVEVMGMRSYGWADMSDLPPGCR